jgi:putative PEP-CTERM system TPR-repeat lipoprotein
MSSRIRKLALASASVMVLSAGLAGCKKEESSAALVAQAKQFQQKGEYGAATIQLKNALVAKPDDAEARFLLASVSAETGDALAAEKEVRKAIDLKYPSAQTLPLLAKVLLMQNQYQKALDEIGADSKQGGVELVVLRADAKLGLGKVDEARQLYESALQLYPQQVQALLGMGRVAAAARDINNAVKYADQAVAAAPADVDALLFKADLLRAEGKTDAALAGYDAVLKVKPAHRTAHIEKAYLEAATGKFEAAQADLAAAAKTTPGSMMVAYTQALLDFTQGKNAAARESLQKVLRVAPEHMPSILLYGAVELNLGDLEQAGQLLRKYVGKNPENLYARKLLATTLLRRGQNQDALGVLAPALKSGQQDVQLLSLAGEAQMQAREFSKASEYFEQASKQSPQASGLRTWLGLSKLGKGDQAAGLGDLELATTLDPKSLPAGVALARAQIGLKHYEQALAAIARLEKMQPDNAMVQELKGAAQLGKNDASAARASFERALVLSPTSYPAVASLVQMDLQARQPQQARQRLLAFLDKDKDNVDAMSALAGVAGSQGQMAEATSWLEKAAAAKPDAVVPAIRLAVQYLRTNQQEKALALARRMQVANPGNAEVLDLLGQAQVATNHPGDAVETYNMLVRSAPRSTLAQLRLAGAYLKNGNEAAAVVSLKKALSLKPDFLEAQLALASLDANAGRGEQALATARQIQKQRPQVVTGWLLEGDLLQLQKKPDAALAAYGKAAALGAEPSARIKLASALKQAGKDKEAEQRLQRWIKDTPSPQQVAPLQLYLAELYMGAAQFPPAVEQLQAVLRLQPDHVGALNNLAYAYQQSKDGRALATAEQAQKLAPENPAVMDTLGWVLLEQGQVARALPLLQKAAAQAPAALDIRYHLAYGYFQAGKKAEAKKELDEVFAAKRHFSQIDAAKTLRDKL